MKIEITRRRLVSAEFTNALTIFSRTKGLDTKYSWHLAVLKRTATDESATFTEAREAAIERNGGRPTGENGSTEWWDGDKLDPKCDGQMKCSKEVNALLNAVVTVEFPPGRVPIDKMTELTADIIEPLMEFIEPPKA